MKKKFEKPEIKVIEFDADDIIMTSGEVQLMSSTYSMKSGNVATTVFNNDWLGSVDNN